MAITPQSAARRICERGNWAVTSLALQKILYLAHMVQMGRRYGRLIDAVFEAWDYGPVEPGLYRRVRMFGDRPIGDIFFGARDISNTSEGSTIDETCSRLLGKKPGELVALTHWEQGAWAKNYVPGIRGIVIPDRDIIAEYDARISSVR